MLSKTSHGDLLWACLVHTQEMKMHIKVQHGTGPLTIMSKTDEINRKQVITCYVGLTSMIPVHIDYTWSRAFSSVSIHKYSCYLYWNPTPENVQVSIVKQLLLYQQYKIRQNQGEIHTFPLVNLLDLFIREQVLIHYIHILAKWLVDQDYLPAIAEPSVALSVLQSFSPHAPSPSFVSPKITKLFLSLTCRQIS